MRSGKHNETLLETLLIFLLERNNKMSYGEIVERMRGKFCYLNDKTRTRSIRKPLMKLEKAGIIMKNTSQVTNESVYSLKLNTKQDQKKILQFIYDNAPAFQASKKPKVKDK